MIHTISNDYLTVKISSKGGELQSICTKNGQEYLWQGDKDSWNRHAPNLFPMVGRLIDGTYRFHGKEYAMGQHGFLRDNELKVVSEEENKIVFSFEDNEETLKMYPFHFIFTLTYTLEGNKLSTSYDVKNNGDDNMYFGLGGHPGFNVPIDKELKFEDYYLQFEDNIKPLQTPLTDNFFISKETIPYTFDDKNRINLKHELFDHDAIILSNAGNTVELKSDRSDHSILFDFDNFEFIAFWHSMNMTPDFVCIEPWTSHSSFDGEYSDFETKEDLIKLPAKETFNRHWSVTIR